LLTIALWSKVAETAREVVACWAILAAVLGLKDGPLADEEGKETSEAPEKRPPGGAGLVYMWNRWQDPDTGTFLSEDPAQAGSNFYRYADSNPLTESDSTGLEPHGDGAADGYGSDASNHASTYESTPGTKSYNVTHQSPVAPGTSLGNDPITGQPLAALGNDKSGYHFDHWAGNTPVYSPDPTPNAPGPNNNNPPSGHSGKAAALELPIDGIPVPIPLPGPWAVLGALPFLLSGGGDPPISAAQAANPPQPGPAYGPENKAGPITGPWAGSPTAAPPPVGPPNGKDPLSSKIKRAIEKIRNAIRDHVTPDDIAGAGADALGNPIPKAGGGFWDHLQEMTNTLRGLRTNEALLRNVDDPEAQAAAQAAREAIQQIEDAIKGLGL
jgi:RHS repeat-associated protein